MKKLKDLFLLLGLHSLLLDVKSDSVALTQEISNNKLYELPINPKILKLQDSIEIYKKKLQKQREYGRVIKRKFLVKPNSSATSKCEKIKCAPGKEPVCAKLSFKNGTANIKKNFFHMILASECEMEYVKCRKGLNGKVVPMEICELNIAKYTNPVIRRSKREISGEIQTKITFDIKSEVLQNKTTLPPSKRNEKLQNNNLNNTINIENVIPKKIIKSTNLTKLRTDNVNEKDVNDTKRENIKFKNIAKRGTVNSINSNKTDAESNNKPIKTENAQKINIRTQNTSKKIPTVVKTTTEVIHVYQNLNTPKLQDEDKFELNEIKTNEITEPVETRTAKIIPIGRTNDAVRSKGRQYFEKNVDQKPMFTHNVFSNDNGQEEMPPNIGSGGNDGQYIEGTIDIEGDGTVGEHDIQGSEPINDGAYIKGAIEIDDDNYNANAEEPKDDVLNIEGANEMDDDNLNANAAGTVDDVPYIKGAIEIDDDNLNANEAGTVDDVPYIKGAIEINDDNLNANEAGIVDDGPNIKGAIEIDDDNLNANEAGTVDDGPYIKGAIEIDDENLNANAAGTVDDVPYIKGAIEIDDDNLNANEAGTVDDVPYIKGAIEINDDNLNASEAGTVDDGPNIKGAIEIDDDNLNANEAGTVDDGSYIKGAIEIDDENLNTNEAGTVDDVPYIKGVIELDDEGLNTNEAGTVDDVPYIIGAIEIDDENLNTNEAGTVDDVPYIKGAIEIDEENLNTNETGTIDDVSNIEGATEMDTENLNANEAETLDDGPNIKGEIEIDDENLNINPSIDSNEESQLEVKGLMDDENLNGELNSNADMTEPAEGDGDTNADQDFPQIEGTIEISDAELSKNSHNDYKASGEKLHAPAEYVAEEPQLDDPNAEDYQFEPPESPSPVIETVVNSKEIVDGPDNEQIVEEFPGDDEKANDDNIHKYGDEAKSGDENNVDDDANGSNENFDDVGGDDASEGKDDNKNVNKDQYTADCPSQCPSTDLMVCAKCQHGIHKTFLSVCHMRMFQCAHKDETIELVSRQACVLSAPYITDTLQMEPKGRVQEPNDQDPVLQYIQCRASGKLDKDPKCAFNEKESQHLNLAMTPNENKTITEY